MNGALLERYDCSCGFTCQAKQPREGNSFLSPTSRHQLNPQQVKSLHQLETGEDFLFTAERYLTPFHTILLLWSITSECLEMFLCPCICARFSAHHKTAGHPKPQDLFVHLHTVLFTCCLFGGTVNCPLRAALVEANITSHGDLNVTLVGFCSQWKEIFKCLK